jgi:uncharacterized protein YutE (UPF0331/DUF86 family)
LVGEQVVMSRLDHLRSVLEELRLVRPTDLDTLLDPARVANRRATERCLYLAIQDVLDISAHIVAAEGWGYPGSYREAAEKLSEQGVVSEDLGATMAAMAGFRNILEHGYVELDPVRLLEYSHRERDFERFAEQVVAFLNRA